MKILDYAEIVKHLKIKTKYYYAYAKELPRKRGFNWQDPSDSSHYYEVIGRAYALEDLINELKQFIR